MDSYSYIAFQSKIYPEKIITDFAGRTPKWSLKSSKEKESLLLKIYVNVLLCNLEIYEDEAESAPKRKRQDDVNKDGPQSKKRAESVSSVSQASSSESATSWEDDSLYKNPEETHYRLLMAKYMLNPQLRQSSFCRRHGIENINRQVDLLDHKEQKMIVVIFTSSDQEKVVRNVMLSNKHKSVAYCLIDPNKVNFNWINHPGDLAGLEKATTFLHKRIGVMKTQGIIETTLMHSSSLQKEIFVSPTFNSALSKWTLDWLKESYVSYTEEFLYGGNSNNPKRITAKQLLSGLSNLEEKERERTIKFKGKLSPEGWVHNINGKWGSDEEMVECYLNWLREFTSNIDTIEPISKYKDFEKNKRVLEEIFDMWENSEKSTLIQFTPTHKKQKHPCIERMLGIGMRKRSFNPKGENMKQKDSVIMEPEKYDNYFEEIIRRMNQCACLPPNSYVYPELLEEPIEIQHPLDKISEWTVTSMLKEMLRTNTALYSSKYTNTFSRIAGAYGGGTSEHNRMRNSVSIFPICGNYSSIENGTIGKIISGLILRGPNHAKNPTDRIPILVLESFIANEENEYLITHLNSGMVYKAKNFYVTIRPNSVMKEDAAYLTFTNTALYNPINMMGLLTLENEDIEQNCNVVKMVEETMNHDMKFFIERFTEGILMAAIGNSRDEGYFACCRKIFMILYSWRGGDLAANWDIESFCKKTNDNLVDNPLSMHFHLNVLDVIRKYISTTDNK